MTRLEVKWLLLAILVASSESERLSGWSERKNGLQKDGKAVSIVCDPSEITVVMYEEFYVNFTLSGSPQTCINLTVTSSPKQITNLPPPITICQENTSSENTLSYIFNTTKEGIITLQVEAQPQEAVNTDEAFVNVNVKKRESVDTASDVMGWIYTIAWDISFLPQIVHNWRRKSVIGLSFDYLTFNVIGFSCYLLFNIGLYWIPAIQEQYYLKYPQTILHVRLNDVIFPLYAVICTVIQILQCFIYERGDQRVSTTCRIISGLLLTSGGIYAILSATVDYILWIDFLYYLSYIKLAITCIKYTPQLYQNFKLKSTEGWSIWNVLLDFTGGLLSLIQMFLLAYNYDDYHSVLTDPTKLGLGLLSIFFNILFFIQHFCLYRNNLIEKPTLEETEDKKQSTITRF